MEQFSSLLTGAQANVNLSDPNEVSANRMGQLTAAQEKRLTATAMGGGCAAFTGPVFAGVIFLFFFLIIFLDNSMGWFAFIPLVIFAVIGIGASGAIIDWFQLNRKLKIDRENKFIRSALGELAFDRKKGYIVQAGEQKLRLPPSANAGGLTPGVRYNFYYLPESTIILSAEQVGTASGAQVRNALTGILAIANDFNLEDLQANQNNEITPGQRSRVIRKALLGFLPIALVLIIFLIGFAPFFLVANKTTETTMPFIIMGIVFLGVAGFGAWTVFNTILDLNSATPEMLDGSGSKVTRQKGSGRSRRTVYYYVIGSKEFEVSRTAYKALISGQTYRVYYTPRTNRLLSIEATGGSDSLFNY